MKKPRMVSATDLGKRLYFFTYIANHSNQPVVEVRPSFNTDVPAKYCRPLTKVAHMGDLAVPSNTVKPKGPPPGGRRLVFSR